MVWQTNFLTDFCLKTLLIVKKYYSVESYHTKPRNKIMVNLEKVKLQSELGLGVNDCVNL